MFEAISLIGGSNFLTIVAEVGTGGLASPIVIPLDIAATATGASLLYMVDLYGINRFKMLRILFKESSLLVEVRVLVMVARSQCSREHWKNDKLASQGHVDAGVSGAPKVDAGKQGKHVPGHGNNVSTKSQWGAGKNGVVETQEAWVKGTPVKPDGSVRVHDFGKPIGPNGETRVKVHMDGKGNIHGYPVQ
ncbi:hypothetical protein LQK80_16060 [Bacillus thuringiensis]|nr:hypothetical protein [Bacillus thuringiensis]